MPDQMLVEPVLTMPCPSFAGETLPVHGRHDGAMETLRVTLEALGIGSVEEMTWKNYETIMRVVEPLIGAGHRLRHFDYTHSAALQLGTVERLRTDYTIRLAYTEWGSPQNPALLCLGGIANSARRFDYVARALSHRYHVLCLDWAGRGRSGWLADQSDYSFDGTVAQVLALIRHKQLGPVTLLGSSLGGSVAMRVAAEAPDLVERLILNDIGPFIPTERRRRRANPLPATMSSATRPSCSTAPERPRRTTGRWTTPFSCTTVSTRPAGRRKMAAGSTATTSGRCNATATAPSRTTTSGTTGSASTARCCWCTA